MFPTFLAMQHFLLLYLFFLYGKCNFPTGHWYQTSHGNSSRIGAAAGGCNTGHKTCSGEVMFGRYPVDGKKSGKPAEVGIIVVQERRDAINVINILHWLIWKHMNVVYPIKLQGFNTCWVVGWFHFWTINSIEKNSCPQRIHAWYFSSLKRFIFWKFDVSLLNVQKGMLQVHKGGFKKQHSSFGWSWSSPVANVLISCKQNCWVTPLMESKPCEQNIERKKTSASVPSSIPDPSCPRKTNPNTCIVTRPQGPHVLGKACFSITVAIFGRKATAWKSKPCQVARVWGGHLSKSSTCRAEFIWVNWNRLK